MEDTESIFTELIRSIERSHSELIRLIRDQEKQAVSRAEGRLERLEQEINDLRRRDAELEQLSHTQDHIQFLQVTQILTHRPELPMCFSVSGKHSLLSFFLLQSVQSFSVSPESTDKPITISSLLSFNHVQKSVSKLKEKLEDFCREEIELISGRGNVSYHT